MPSIAPLQPASLRYQDSTNGGSAAASRLADNAPDSRGDLESNFQDFVAGTFYKEMLKSLNKMHGKPAYFDGGQAEKMFRGQLDQQMSENLAKTNGSQFSDSLYQDFLNHKRA
jgi:Rod binding domain-containing protein